MSLRKVQNLKMLPTYIKTTLRLRNPFRINWRRYATNSRMKIPLSGGGQHSYVPRASLSARSPFVHERVFGEEKPEEQALPQHEPGHFALMPPLRPAKQLSLFHQQNILNGNRLPPPSEGGSDPVDCISALEKVRRMEESRKVHKKMLDLMQQQLELSQCLQDRQDEKSTTTSGGGGTRPGVTSWASKSEPQSDSLEQPEEASIREGSGTRPGSINSATALVAAELPSPSSMYSHRSMQKPPRVPKIQGFRLDEEQYHRQFQKAYHPRNMKWPDYSASTIQSYKNAVTPKGKKPIPLYSVRPDCSDNSDDSGSDDSDSDSDAKESIRRMRPDNKDSKPTENLRSQDILELHKARATELEKRAIEGLSKKSATSLVVEQKVPSRGKVVIKSYKFK